jgi:hypothetical protein
LHSNRVVKISLFISKSHLYSTLSISLPRGPQLYPPLQPFSSSRRSLPLPPRATPSTWRSAARVPHAFRRCAARLLHRPRSSLAPLYSLGCPAPCAPPVGTTAEMQHSARARRPVGVPVAVVTRSRLGSIVRLEGVAEGPGDAGGRARSRRLRGKLLVKHTDEGLD